MFTVSSSSGSPCSCHSRSTQMDCDSHLAQCLSEMNVDMTWWALRMLCWLLSRSYEQPRCPTHSRIMSYGGNTQRAARTGKTHCTVRFWHLTQALHWERHSWWERKTFLSWKRVFFWEFYTRWAWKALAAITDDPSQTTLPSYLNLPSLDIRSQIVLYLSRSTWVSDAFDSSWSRGSPN